MIFSNSFIYWYIKRKFRKLNVRPGMYSQYGQDKLVFELLGNKQCGNFVDIGANDGVTFSNSLFFEEKGWSGICVEPHSTIFKNLEKRRKCKVLNACISDTNKDVTFYQVEGASHMLSGIKEFMDERHFARIRREISGNGGAVTEVKIQAITPRSLLLNHNVSKVDFLSVDTEGCELSILKFFNFNEIPVACISVENGSRSPAIFKHLTSNGFHLYCCIGCDEVYLRDH